MKKNILVAVGLALSLAGVASAQQGGERGERARGARGAEDANRGPRADRGRGGPDGMLLKGITLTEGQRAHIAQVSKTQRDALAATRESRKAEMEQMRSARQRGDTAAVRAAMLKNRQAMEQQRATRVATIRNILTAEQRVVFDRNVAEMQQRQVGQKGQGAKGQKGKRAKGR